MAKNRHKWYEDEENHIHTTQKGLEEYIKETFENLSRTAAEKISGAFLRRRRKQIPRRQLWPFLPPHQ